VCSVDGCAQKHKGRGYCQVHYRRIVLGHKPRPQSKALMRSDPTDERHGTVNGYSNCDCRCPECTRAHADGIKAYLDADPQRRRKWNERQLDRLERLRNG
jgi:hypothetical protein